MRKHLSVFIILISIQFSFSQMNTHFVTNWKTDNLQTGSTNNTSIEIPTDGVSTYLYDVDWDDDGAFDELGITGNVTHDFGSVGTYTIRIRGDFPHFYSNFYSDRDKILSVNQWGSQQWVSMLNSFMGCPNISIIATDIPDLSMATSLQGMFISAVSFNNYIGNWDVSTINNFNSMFSGATSYNQFIGNWDMSAATNLIFTFNNATNFNQPIGNWNVAGVTDFSSMFSNATNFNQPIKNWDVSNALSFGNMFTNATNFNQSLDNWNLSNANSIYSMFSGAINFNQPLNNWNVSNITSFNLLFNGASSFNQPLNNWQFGVGSNLYGFFLNATSFNQPLDNWNIQNTTSINGMFKGANSFNQDISIWDVSSISVISNMFESATNFDQDLSSWDISNIQYAFDTFNNCGLSSRNYDNIVTNWNAQPHNNNVNFGAIGIYYCNALPAITALQADGWTITNAGTNCESTYFVTTWKTTTPSENITIPTEGTSTYLYDVDWDGDSTFDAIGETGSFTHLYPTAGTHTIKIRGIFPRIYFNNGGDKLKIYEVNQWGNQPWTSMESSFTNCANLEITATDTPDITNATSMRYMFWRCYALNSGLEKWDVSSITDMRDVFSYSNNFNSDISSWDTSSANNMFSMFLGCTNFNRDISGWNVGNVTLMSNMFSNATAFNQNLGSWDISNLVTASNMLSNVTLSNSNYDALLIGWQGQPHNNNVTFSGGNSQYCNGEAAWNTLDITDSWIITDDGKDCENTYFITTWQTTTANETITIPTFLSTTYLYDIDWDGDSIFDSLNATGNETHNYITPGNHTIKIRGDFPRIYFNNSGDREKILQINQWGSQIWQSMGSAFYGCSNLDGDAIDVPDLSSVSVFSKMFKGALFFNGNLSNWDVSNISNMFYMFSGASAFNNNGNSLTSWDVSNVTNMSGMFENATIFDQDIGNWNISNVTNIQSMFSNAAAFDQNIGNWNVSKISNMYRVFKNAVTFNQDIGKWNVSSVKKMGSMFSNADAFNQDIGKWNVSKVEDMNHMFFLTAIFNQDISSWNVSKVTNMLRMFSNAKDFNNGGQPLNWVSGTGTSKVTNMYSMFFNADSFNQDLSSWNVSEVTNMTEMFALTNVYNNGGKLLNWINGTGTFNVIDMKHMFYEATAFNQNFNWDVSNVSNMSRMFYGATLFNQDLNSWNVSSVTTMFGMFDGATDFNQNLGSWNIENLTDASWMFDGITLSTTNYDALITGWQNNLHNNNVTFSGGNSKYCLSENDWNTFENTDSWTITDGGKDCDDCLGTPITWNGTWSGTPNLYSPVTINANYDTANDGNFTSCNCTINSGFTVNVRNGDFIDTNDMDNNGSILIENNGSFAQNSNTAITTGTGYFKVDRETTPYAEYDYTYWSTPTNVETIGSVFTNNSTLVAGASHVNAINDDGFSNPSRIYKFNAANFHDGNGDTFDDNGDDWENVLQTTIMNPCEGYIAMGAGADFPFDTNFATGLKQNIFFEGTFNSGTKNKMVYTDADPDPLSPNLNLIGNPYPSAIDINLLMKENLSRLGGTFYFWTHDSPISGANPGPNSFDFNNNDYAVATSNGSVFNYISNGTNNTTTRPYIATAQSVMASVLNQGNIVFNNEMRITTANESYRPANQPDLDRIWLNLTNSLGVFRQLLVGFYEHGSNTYENGLDGERPNNGNAYDFYSIIENDDKRFAIQTQDEFNISKTIPIGIEIINSGNFKISIDHLEGVFENGQHIYIQDNETETIHDLSISDYNFNINSTADLRTRFELKFTNSTVNIDGYNFNSISIYPNPSENGIFNISWNDTDVINYKITDVTGKKIIKNQSINNNIENKIDLSSFEKGIYYIQIMQNEKQIEKKLIVR